jgi:hypothetical protein
MGKATTKHPYAAIDHRVLDSEAYADLSHSTRSVLTMLTRQLNGKNNGHLQATASYMKRYGICEKSVQRGIASLIEHGFVYRSCADRMKPGGNDWTRIAAKYAVTWLSITNREGLFLDGFLSFAWRNWQPNSKKIPTVKKALAYSQIDRQLPIPTVKLTVHPQVKNTDYELLPIPAVKDGRKLRRHHSSAHAILLRNTADRGTQRINH